MSQDNTRIPIIPLDTYVRITFKQTIAERRTSKKIVTGRIAKDAVQKMSLFSNEFIRDITRAAVKIAQNTGRKTIMNKDIDTAVFTIYHPTTYEHFGPDKLDLYKWYYDHFKREIEPKKTKSRYTLMEKWNFTFPPARIDKIMRLVSKQDMRIADDAILLMTVLVNEIIRTYLIRAQLLKKNVREMVDPETGKKIINVGIISWNDILETNNKDNHIRITTCKYNRY